ncbi:methylamine dehydrogenase light chain [Paraglaciecola sp. Hal342]
MDGFLCSCCGGSQSACPPGTEMSPITWIGTCLNPADNKHYIISYNDCCGKAACGRCFCNRNEDDTPMYRAFSNNDTNWCVGASSETYVCSTAVILGTSIES